MQAEGNCSDLLTAQCSKLKADCSMLTAKNYLTGLVPVLLS